MIWFPSYDLYIIVLIGFQEMLFLSFQRKVKEQKTKSCQYTRGQPCRCWKEPGLVETTERKSGARRGIAQTLVLPHSLVPAHSRLAVLSYWQFLLSADLSILKYRHVITFIISFFARPNQLNRNKKKCANYSLIMTVVW